MAKQFSHLVDYTEDSQGKSSASLSFHFGGDLKDYQAEHFQEAMYAWMSALGMKTVPEMLHRLDLDTEGGVSEQDFLDLLSDKAVPGPYLTRYLTEAYRSTMAGTPLIKEMTPGEFSKLAHLQYQQYERTGRNDFGTPYHVVRIEPSLLEHTLVARHTPEGAQAALRPKHQRLVSRTREETTGSPFYTEYQALLGERSESLGHTRPASAAKITPSVLEQTILLSLNIDKRTLQGFLPLPRDKDGMGVSVELANFLFGQEGLSEGDGAYYRRQAFEKNAAAFLDAIPGFDYVNARRHNGLETYGQSLRTLLEWTDIPAHQLSAEMKKRGFNVTVPVVHSYLGDAVLPNPIKARAIGDILHLDDAQREELRHAYDLSYIRQKVSSTLAFDLQKTAGTDDFHCAHFCQKMFETVPLNLDALGYYTGIYPGTLRAYRSGELIPSKGNMTVLCDFFGADAGVTGALAKLTERQLGKVADPQKRAVHKAFGGATMETSSQDIVRQLIHEGGGQVFTAEGISLKGDVPIGTVYNCYQRHHPQDEKTIDGMMRGIGVAPDSNIRKAYAQANRQQKIPFGIALEDYMATGGHNLAEFLKGFISKERGWNISERAFLQMIGLNAASTGMFEGTQLKSGREVEKITTTFNLSPHQELLLWRLGRGNHKDITPEVAAKGAQSGLQGGEDSTAIAYRLFDYLLAYSGLTEKRLSELTHGKDRHGKEHTVSAGTLTEIASRKRSLGNLSFESLDQLGHAFSPFNDALARNIANAFMGLSHDKSPRELLDEARKEGDFGTLIRTARLQMRMKQADFGHAIKVVHGGHQGVTQGSLGKWERGEGYVQNDEMARAFAVFLGYEDPKDVKDFINIARGRYVNPESILSPEALLQKARGGEFPFSKFVETVMNQEGLSNNGMAVDITQKTAQKVHDVQIKKWLQGKEATPLLAEAFARRMGYDGADKDFFVAYASTPGHTAEKRGWQEQEKAGRGGKPGDDTPPPTGF
jgi:transcriptional regulator with XRE-family HTH domain